ncbi:glycosyltransferase family 2 protein [Acidovorax cavernicola]|uniref:Glycosyltransferase n=1 Tax=Acidovorax cavernicola TaxID=1675792 RepID=A0A9X8D5A0_9BURK|nr:glycosyltransferase [Acidovorax cavernicola]RIX79397.1 glycosyltransferase [Acidovorax cavernicola]
MFISIGIPVFNAEAYIADAVRSVFSQTHKNWELLLVDDGSTDRSLEIINSIRDPRVRVISDGLNKGLPFRLNQISQEARFEYLARMDADDLMSPRRLEKQLNFLVENPSFDLVTSGVCSITNNNFPAGFRIESNSLPISGKNLLLGRNQIVHAAILGRRTWFLRNPYDVSLRRTEDYELWLRSFSMGDFKVSVINEPLYYYREEGSATIEKLLAAYSSQRGLYKKFGPRYFTVIELNALFVKSFGKSAAVRLLKLVNKLDLIVRRRNQPILDRKMLAEFQEEINRVLSFSVSGL